MGSGAGVQDIVGSLLDGSHTSRPCCTAYSSDLLTTGQHVSCSMAVLARLITSISLPVKHLRYAMLKHLLQRMTRHKYEVKNTAVDAIIAAPTPPLTMLLLSSLTCICRVKALMSPNSAVVCRSTNAAPSALTTLAVSIMVFWSKPSIYFRNADRPRALLLRFGPPRSAAPLAPELLLLLLASPLLLLLSLRSAALVLLLLLLVLVPSLLFALLLSRSAASSSSNDVMMSTIGPTASGSKVASMSSAYINQDGNVSGHCSDWSGQNV